MTPKSTHTAYECVTGCGKMHIEIPDNLAKGKFGIKLGRNGTCAFSQCDAFSRMLNISFKLGADPLVVAPQLQGITCQHQTNAIGDNPVILSCADAIAQTLKGHYQKEAR